MKEIIQNNISLMRSRIVKIIRPEKPGVVPGYRPVWLFTSILLLIFILVPLSTVVIKVFEIGSFKEFISVISNPLVVSGYKVTILCSLAAAAANAVFGLILAWTLVRYDFPFKNIIDGLIELPFALPTSVAGIALTYLYSDKGFFGQFAAKFGIKIAYTKAGIIIAMIFVGIPFVVRSVQPVLKNLDKDFEEASVTLGADRKTTFLKVIFPEIFPSLIAGFSLAFARDLGEYGSVVFIAGNIPKKTQIVPLIIVSKLEQLNYSDASAIAFVLLLLSFTVAIISNALQLHFQKYVKSDNVSGIAKTIIPLKFKVSHIREIGLVTIDYLFIIIMLIVPLLTVVINSLKDGVRAYFKYISNPYTMSAFRLTVFASFISVIVVTVFGILAAFLLTKYNFRGKQVFASLIDIPLSISPVIAGLAYILTFGSIGFLGPFLEAHGIKIAFAVPGIVLVTIFVTFPYVFRELFPVMNAYGNDEEEAASLFGAGFFSILHSITLPNFRWALWYGVTLAFARALGEFGAVSVISGHLRGKTNTLPLQVEVLFNDFDTTASFAAASLLVITAVIILIIKSFFLKKGGQ